MRTVYHILLGLVTLFLLVPLGVRWGTINTHAQDQQTVKSPWTRLGPPRPGDWLSVFREPGQTYAQYIREATNPRNETRTTIYILPLGISGEQENALISEVAEYAGIFFDTPVVVQKSIPMPPQAHDPKRGQTDAHQLLGLLASRVPDDALALAGMTDKDLYSGALNFVFGLASLEARVGVYSFYRYRSDPKTMLKRTCKVMTHELGHIFSMRHCIEYHCLMNGSNSLSESDARPMVLCPVCAKKLEYNFKGIDMAARYEKLRRFYRKHGWSKDARLVGRIRDFRSAAKSNPPASP